MKHFISAILVILTISCKTTREDSLTYFGGEIINPTTDYVLFLKDDEVIDKLTLDENNRFVKGYESLEEGLYTFKHGNEFQYLYLEPADSILVRLNTWDFDESLVYSGKGSSKNEYLIKLFLQNEKEEMAMMPYLSLNAADFQFKLDSLAKERTLAYDEFVKNEGEFSDDFQKLTNAAIHLTLDRLKEIYPLYHKLDLKSDKYVSIPDNFYNFRNNISLNEANLVSFYSYQNYVMSYLYNLSYALKENDSTKSDITTNILNAIIENIELESFKNTLLMRITVDNFLNSASTCTINEQTLNIFLDNCTNEKFVQQVKNLVNDIKYIEGNKPLPNFEIVTYDNQKLNIGNVVKDQNSVIYFWSTGYLSSDYLVSRIQYLEKQYPSVEFIGINFENTSDDINNEPNLKKFNVNKQFKLTDDSYAHSFLTSNYPRVIIVNSNGFVENGYSLLHSKKLDLQLNKLK